MDKEGPSQRETDAPNDKGVLGIQHLPSNVYYCQSCNKESLPNVCDLYVSNTIAKQATPQAYSEHMFDTKATTRVPCRFPDPPSIGSNTAKPERLAKNTCDNEATRASQSATSSHQQPTSETAGHARSGN